MILEIALIDLNFFYFYFELQDFSKIFFQSDLLRKLKYHPSIVDQDMAKII